MSLLILSYVAALSSRSLPSLLLVLVLSYVTGAVWLISKGLIYSGLLYILVYVGAIVVLFVYVIQLVDTTYQSTIPSRLNTSVLLGCCAGLLSLPWILPTLIGIEGGFFSLLVSGNDSSTTLNTFYPFGGWEESTLQELASYLFGDYAYVLVMSVHAIVLAVIGPVRLALSSY